MWLIKSVINIFIDLVKVLDIVSSVSDPISLHFVQDTDWVCIRFLI